jgi:signal transduction histidine kinase
MTAQAFLASVPLFAGVTSDHLRSIVAAGRTTTVPGGQIVFREGDASDGLYIVLAGRVRIYKQNDNGTEVELVSAGPGEFFGELGLIDGGPRSASVASLAPCEFFVLARNTFLTQLSQSPQLLAATLANLSRTVRSTSERVLRQALEQQALRSEMELARYRSLAQMVAGVAHEINTPLGTINTAASIVKRRLAAEVLGQFAGEPKALAALDDAREAADLIAANIARAHKLVQDFKKLSVSQISDTKEVLDLIDVVDEVIGLFRINARKAKLAIEVRHGLSEPAERAWLGYRGYLTQVLLNLLGNIERYAYPDGEGGRVEIEIVADKRRPDEFFLLTVRDFGQGIAADHLPKVFDPFFTTGRSKGGTGLGMAIVHNIVTTALKGSIGLESKLGSGTTVTLRAPRKVPD